MFDPTSRYYTIETVKMTVTDRDGQARVIAYKRRRFIPSLEGTVTIVEHFVAEGDRLDNITARYLGDPIQFWRVCDANLVLLPDELTDERGESIRIALPKF
jgi:hypothetical protein